MYYSSVPAQIHSYSEKKNAKHGNGNLQRRGVLHHFGTL